VLLACVPKVGAALVFNGASMLVGGIQIVMSRPVKMRSTFIVGISLLFALSRRVYPEFFTLLPSWTNAFTDSILSIAVVVCVLLNLAFLIGERRTEIMVLEPGAAKLFRVSTTSSARRQSYGSSARPTPRALRPVAATSCA
jgi:xanthine permease XanP